MGEEVNKVITTLTALVDSASIDIQEENIVCIDTIHSRIGVGTRNPIYDIEIAKTQGILKTDIIYCNNISNTSGNDIFLDCINRKVFCNDICCNDIFCNDICCNDICCNDIFCHDICCNDICCNDIFCHDIVCNELSCNDISSINITHLTSTTISIAGELEQGSDDRFKHNEKNINNGLEIIRKLNPQVYDKTYKFKEENYVGILNEPYIVEAGLIAQEVHSINDISYTVKVGDATSPYYLNYNNIFVYGLAAIKELDAVVNNNISNLLGKINSIENNITNNNITNNNITNLSNIQSLILNQNTLIQSLNSKILNLERRINNIEK